MFALYRRRGSMVLCTPW